VNFREKFALTAFFARFYNIAITDFTKPDVTTGNVVVVECRFCIQFALSMQRNLNIYNMGYLKRIDFLSQIVIGSLTVLSPFVHGPLLEIRKNQGKTKK
jgi:hypothetical protein